MDGKICCVGVTLYAGLSWFLLDFASRELGLDIWIQRSTKDWFDEIATQ